MSDLETIINGAKRVEARLEALGATGRGLHEKLNSIESEVPSNVCEKIRFVATMRNKAAHEMDFRVSLLDLKRFTDGVDMIESVMGGGDVGGQHSPMQIVSAIAIFLFFSIMLSDILPNGLNFIVALGFSIIALFLKPSSNYPKKKGNESVDSDDDINLDPSFSSVGGNIYYSND